MGYVCLQQLKIKNVEKKLTACLIVSLSTENSALLKLHYTKTKITLVERKSKACASFLKISDLITAFVSD